MSVLRSMPQPAEINSSMLPADVGCVVDNVETVIAIYEAVILGKPVVDRVVTITGDGIKAPKNFSVYTGTDMSELIDAAGGLKAKIEKIISGGPMMGFHCMSFIFHVQRQHLRSFSWNMMQ